MSLLYTYYFLDNKGAEKIIYAPSREEANLKFEKFFNHKPAKFVKRERF